MRLADAFGLAHQRQVRRRCQRGNLLAPVVQRLCVAAVIAQALLGQHVIAKGQPRFGQLQLRVGIKGHQFARQNLRTRGVDDQCVKADVQMADALIEQRQTELEQRPATGVQHLMGLTFAGDLQGLLRSIGRQAAQIVAGHVVGRHAVEDLLRAIAKEHHAQHVVPQDHAVQRLLETWHVEAGDAQFFIAMGTDPAEADRRFAAKPVRLLDIGQRKRRVTCAAIGFNRGKGCVERRPVTPPEPHLLGQVHQHRRLEQAAKGQLPAHALVDHVDHPRGQQRMPAQFEKVVVDADLRALEHLGPDAHHLPLGLVARCHVGTGGLPLWYRQRLTVELAVTGQRQLRQRHPGRRHHVFRQVAVQLGTQCFGSCRPHHIGHQTLVARYIFAQQHHRFPHTGLLVQKAVDLAQLDAKTAQFDLLVDATQVVHIAVGRKSRQITAAVHARTGLRVERVRQEAFGAQVRTIQITPGQAGTGDIQLACHADRYRVQVAVQHIQTRIGDRPANRRCVRPLPGVVTVQAELADHVGFGRAVLVVQLRTAKAADKGTQFIIDEQRLASGDDFAAALWQGHRHRRVGFSETGQLLKHGERQKRPLYALGHQRRTQRGEVFATGFAHQHQAAALAQRAADFLKRHVEIQRCELQHAL